MRIKPMYGKYISIYVFQSPRIVVSYPQPKEWESNYYNQINQGYFKESFHTSKPNKMIIVCNYIHTVQLYCEIYNNYNNN